TVSMSAAESTIKGVVTDASGKPVRGATISAVSGMKTVSRFSQKDGKYEIAVASGTYDVTVEAYGYSPKKASVDSTKGGDTNVTLVPANFNLLRLTGAEIESLLPNEREANMVRARCIECHSFPTIVHRRGSNQDEWREFLPHMTRETMNEPFA